MNEWTYIYYFHEVYKQANHSTFLLQVQVKKIGVADCWVQFRKKIYCATYFEIVMYLLLSYFIEEQDCYNNYRYW